MSEFSILHEICSSFPEVTIEHHFEKVSFRIKKKIFVSFDKKMKLASVKLTELDQDLFILAGTPYVYPVPNTWEKQGWTFVDLSTIDKHLLFEIIEKAYHTVSSKGK